jgi:hypothetical protein
MNIFFPLENKDYIYSTKTEKWRGTESSLEWKGMVYEGSRG